MNKKTREELFKSRNMNESNDLYLSKYPNFIIQEFNVNVTSNKRKQRENEDELLNTNNKRIFVNDNNEGQFHEFTAMPANLATLDIKAYEKEEKKRKREEARRLKEEARLAREEEKRQKQLKKEEMKRIKEEEKRKKEEEKRKREEEKLRLSIQREEARKKKEEERKAKELLKKQKEEERRLKKEQEEIEKKKRQEELLLKRKKKEEEERAKEEQRRLKELEKKKKEEQAKKQAAILMNFVKKNVNETNNNNGPFQNVGQFVAWQVPEGSIFSQCLYLKPFDEDKFEFELKNSNSRSPKDTLEEIKRSKTKKTSAKEERINKRKKIFEGSIDFDTVGDEESERIKNLILSSKIKFFKFHDNVRPEYFGTFTQTSNKVTPKNPFARDDNIDYDADSDEEWEDANGEDLDDSVGEDDQEEIEDYEYDEFLVEDGYLSDGEGWDGDEDSVCKKKSYDEPITKEKSSHSTIIGPISCYPTNDSNIDKIINFHTIVLL